MDIQELQRHLQSVWHAGTSSDPDGWTSENPAWGQCAVTALTVQDFFGGELLRASLEDVPGYEFMRSHYFNLLPSGEVVDLSASQFSTSAYKKIPEGELNRTRQDLIGHDETRPRFVDLRLRIQNEITPNPLFWDEAYKACFEAAQFSDCEKMRFGCVAVTGLGVVATTANCKLEALSDMCEPECCRNNVQSRTDSWLGACGHAEEHMLARFDYELDLYTPEECTFYIAGFYPDNTPYIKDEAVFTCIRCATQLYMREAGEIKVPVVDRWETMSAEQAVQTARQYALGEKTV